MSELIKLENVRLSFPNIFEKETYEGAETKYGATFLIPKSNKKLKRKLDLAIQAKIEEAKIKKRIPEDKICLKDGDDAMNSKGEIYQGYENHWSMKATNNKKFKVVDADGTSPLDAHDCDRENKLYSGCYVNAYVTFWVQNNSYGIRVNANLHAIQFFKDGDPFATGSNISDDDLAFENHVDEDDDEDYDDI